MISLLVSVLVSGVQLLLVYRQQVFNAEQQLDDIGSGIVPSLSASLWLVDSDRVDLLLDGLIKYPGVVYVELDSEGRRETRGKPIATPALQRTYPLSYEQTGRFPLGRLYIAVDKGFIITRLWNESLRVALSTLAGLGTASLMLLLLFRGWVTRHLEHMASYARNIGIDQLEKQLTLERPPRRWPDEIDQMAAAFNQLRERIVEDMAKRDRQEHELQAYRDHLESLVRLRTMTLQEQAIQLESQKLELQRLAHTDSLTGLSNRRDFLEHLENAIRCSREEDPPLCVLMLDIDHFKAINDDHGHAVGDRALVALADTCRQQLRDGDNIGRLGGEEFGIVLPQTRIDSAEPVADRLREALSGVRVPDANGGTLGFTVSIGLAQRSGPWESASELLLRADRALYQAKREGRNRVIVAPLAHPHD
ncbi:sensor domain-containing diguanylate cyclase [Dyella ginsengisoli]|uniref:sensor domain-containing diguanylate cyclase n=1 Tax=Dyella ginsengisoli TaxID=363848 RepID=UPI0018E2368E|nr:diguanylate cyclase [Dyella ginsengisoli]